MTTATTTEAGEALRVLSAAVATVASLELDRLSDTGLVEVARELEVLSRQLQAASIRADGHVSDRGVHKDLGHLTDTSLVRSVHRLTRGEANARLRLAELVCGRRTVTGEVLAPVLTYASDAFASGQISAAHVEVIGGVLARVPESLRPANVEFIDDTLTEHARSLDTRDLTLLGERIIATLDPDGPAPSEEIRENGRSGRLTISPDGWGRLEARLTPSAVAIWQTVLTPLLKARPHTHDPDGQAGGDADATEGEGEGKCRDTRRPAEKFHDALEAAGMRLLKTGDLPSTAGVPTTLILTLSLTELETRVGRATTHHGGVLTVPEALRLATQAKLIPMLFNDTTGILAYGRNQRLAQPGQRRVLTARDTGCTFPGCTVPAAWAEIHHIRPWLHGGPTNLDNMCIACAWHQNEAVRQGWTAQLIDGRPWWTPPTHVDPDQTPLRNTYWDPPPD